MKTVKLSNRKGSIVYELMFYIIVAALLLITVAPLNSTVIKSTSDDILKSQALSVDNALSQWYSSHGGKFPDNLTILQDMNFISKSVQLNLFSYSLQNNKTEYRLTAVLKNGTTYKSLGSKF